MVKQGNATFKSEQEAVGEERQALTMRQNSKKSKEEILIAEQSKVTPKEGSVLLYETIAIGEVKVAKALKALKATPMTGSIGAWYKMRGETGADIAGVFAQTKVTFKYSDAAELIEDIKNDKIKVEEDRAMSLSLFTVALATFALAF